VCIRLALCVSVHPIFMIPPPPSPTLFPYTTLFRSKLARLVAEAPELSDIEAYFHDEIVSDSSFMAQSTQALHKPLRDIVGQVARDRKSTRLNSSHVKISYAVFCLKKKIA